MTKFPSKNISFMTIPKNDEVINSSYFKNNPRDVSVPTRYGAESKGEPPRHFFKCQLELAPCLFGITVLIAIIGGGRDACILDYIQSALIHRDTHIHKESTDNIETNTLINVGAPED